MAAANSDIDVLFRLPLNEFTSARNALAARLKAAGQPDAAARVKALPKPPLSAWAVNQLYWRHRKAFDRLMAAGERLRRAQGTQLRGPDRARPGRGLRGRVAPRGAGARGGDLREALEARRVAMSELSRRAAALLEEAGHRASPDLTRRITTTLDALATYGQRPDAPRPGHLTADIDAPGFEALKSLVGRRSGPAGGAGATRVIPFQPHRKTTRGALPLDAATEKRRREADQQAQRAALAAAVRAAERTLAAARKAAARAEAALKQAAACAKTAEQKRDALAARLEQATADAERARDEARRVAAEAEDAAQAVADAERALEDARKSSTIDE